MADVFVECMVKKKPDAAQWMRRVSLGLTIGLLIIIAFFALVLAPMFAFLILPIAFLGVWGLKILINRTNTEYEYILTNSELDIDTIMGRSRRKRILSVDSKSFDIFAPMKPDYAREYESQTIRKHLDFSSSPQSGRRCFAVFNSKNGERTLLVFEPSDRMKDALKTVLRNKYKE